MYKLVAIDLDGTLLNSYGQISQENKNALKQLEQKNIEIVLASGRSTNSVKNIANDLQIGNYIVCGNGSIIYDLKKEEIIYNKFIDKKKVLQIINVCEENSIFYNIYTEDMIISKSLNNNVLFYHYENINKPDNKKTKINLVQDIYKYVQNVKEQNILKITITDSHNSIFNSIIKKLRDIRDIDVLDVAHMSRKMIKSGTEEISLEYYYTEITSQNVDKWNSLKYLASKINIKAEEIAAIGDNVNDKMMIENAGLGFAMGNSAPYIKQIADKIVGDNNENGVAQAIEILMK